MCSTLTEMVTRRRFISFVPLFLLVLSLGSGFSPQSSANTDIRKGIGAPTPTPDWGDKGRWETPFTPFTNNLVASHVSVLPNGKVLAWGPPAYTSPYPTTVQIWDPNATCPSCITDVSPSPTTFGILYCSGHSFLADGNLLITGGSANPGGSDLGINKATLFNYTNNSWTALPAMNDKRWYPTNLPLSDGSTLVWGGHTVNSVINPDPQVLEKQGDGTYTWRSIHLKNPEPDFQYYSWLNTLSSGKAMVTLGVNGKSFLLSLGGGFKYSNDHAIKYPLHPTNSSLDGQLADGNHHAGSQIVYDKDQLLVIGGSWNLPKDTVERINMNNSTPQWGKVAHLNIGRRHHNSTILADGKVLVTGGNKGDAFNNTCTTNAVKMAEMWDPDNTAMGIDTNTWKPLASASERRIYHSSAVLLPDGRVFTGGTTWFWADGTDPDNPEKDCPVGDPNYTVEIFSPPYLFNADGTNATRPSIQSGPSEVNYGQTYNYTVSNAGSTPKVSLVRLPSVTHSFNQNQGFLKLTPSVSGTTVSITIPVNRNELVPGHYMMFVLNGGVPSVAKIIQVL